MFDIGFWELVLVGLVALCVLGPERLQHVSQHLGRWVARGRTILNGMKSEWDLQAREEKARAAEETND